jgi:hypothetical protein
MYIVFYMLDILNLEITEKIKVIFNFEKLTNIEATKLTKKNKIK